MCLVKMLRDFEVFISLLENCPRYLHELLIGSEIVFPSLPKPARVNNKAIRCLIINMYDSLVLTLESRARS